MNLFEKNAPAQWPWIEAGVCLLMLSGCVTEPTSAETQLGSAVRNAQITQTLHPDAEDRKALSPYSDGGIAKSAMDRYQSSYEVPPLPVNVMNIGLGGSSGVTGR